MTKAEFIDELCRRIKMLPPDEAERAVSYYSEAIDDRVESGMSEEAAVASLGDLDAIAAEVEKAALKNAAVTPEKPKKNGAIIAIIIVLAVLCVLAAFSAVNLISYFTIKGTMESAGIQTDEVLTVTVETVSGEITVGESPDELIHVVHDGSYEINKTYVLTVKPRSLTPGAGSEPVKVLLPRGFTPLVGLNTVSGDIEVSADVGALSVKTASADAELDGIRAESISFKSISGSLKGTLNGSRNEYSVSFSSVSGENHIPEPDLGACIPEKQLFFESVSGDLRLKFKK